jgi:hypothetical protein
LAVAGRRRLLSAEWNSQAAFAISLRRRSEVDGLTDQTSVRREARRLLTVLAVGQLLSACALIEPPTAQLRVARGAIAEAEAAGAPHHAALELEAARTKLADAEDRVRRGDYVGAERLAEAAEADARLAAMRARAAAADSGPRPIPDSSGAPTSGVRR